MKKNKHIFSEYFLEVSSKSFHSQLNKVFLKISGNFIYQMRFVFLKMYLATTWTLYCQHKHTDKVHNSVKLLSFLTFDFGYIAYRIGLANCKKLSTAILIAASHFAQKAH